MFNFILVLMLVGVGSLFESIFSHCQIPCGIYDDKVRFTLLQENITTLEKSIKQIGELSMESQKNMNQIVRWTLNKDEQADEFAHVVLYYFLQQRVKPVEETDKKKYETYTRELMLLHRLLVHAVGIKQTTEAFHIDNLKRYLGEYEKIYMERINQSK